MIFVFLGIVAAGPGSALPPRFESDDHRVIAFAAQSVDTPAYAFTNKGVWDSQTRTWQGPFNVANA